MNEDIFPEPYLYKPERWYWIDKTWAIVISFRWLDGSTDQTNFAFLPFGYGQRVCIGKSIAETSLVMFLIRVFSQFRISWIGGDLDYKTVLINKPDAPLLFHFDPIDWGEAGKTSFLHPKKHKSNVNVKPYVCLRHRHN